jgi:hypothetical protein
LSFYPADLARIHDEGFGEFARAAACELLRRMSIEIGGTGREEVHRLRLYEPEFVLKCLEGPGFSSEALDRYCDFGFWPGYAAFAAVRPS